MSERITNGVAIRLYISFVLDVILQHLIDDPDGPDLVTYTNQYVLTKTAGDSYRRSPAATPDVSALSGSHNG